MKSGKEEEKNMGPLFPRLHVNDTEKGGPRAPPRNKMALYEQLSIPSQRFNSGSASTMPLPPSNTNSLVSSSASLSQGGGHERTVFSQYYIPPPPVNLAEELHSRPSDGLNYNTVTPDFEQKSTSNTNRRASNGMGHMSSTAEGSSFHTRYFPNSKNSYSKNLGDEDDFMVPTFAQAGMGSCTTKHQQNVEREMPSPFAPVNNTSRIVSGTCTSSSQLHNAGDKHLKRPNTTDLRSRQHVRDQDDTSKDYVEKSTSHSSPREKIRESIKHVYASDSRYHNGPDVLGRSNMVNAQLHQECRAPFRPENNERSDGVADDLMVYVDEVNVSRGRNEPCSRSSLGNGHRSPNNFCVDKANGVAQVEDVDRNDEVSETSILDSISSLDISPDDVVGVIGQKHFWKARKAIANQQRVFSVQVFELHRLIKVQRLFAGSPHLLAEDNPYLGKSCVKEFPAKKLPSKYVVKSLPVVIKPKDDSLKANRGTEWTAENAIEKSPVASISDGIDRRNSSQHPTYGPYSENPPPVAPNNQAGWFHAPPGNQWLVPIMSPSEGLVYKPFSGPCPPAAGFMAPYYGGCGPMSLPPMGGDFLNQAYRFPASPQPPMGHHSATPVTPTYFPPYGMPVMNSVISPSAVDQVSPLTEQLSTGEFNVNMHSRNSCNMLRNRRSEAISRRFSKFQTSKESEVQGSTASSPSERPQGVGAGKITEPMGALPLFPTAPAVQDVDAEPQISNRDRQHARVIKVVPHNPRSANESAARIFRSIQEERQQFDSV